MKKALLWVRPNPSQGMVHQKNWIAAFAVGLKKHGWNSQLIDEIRECDLFCIWGTRRKEIIASAKNRGFPICVVERGFLGDRFENCMVGLGGCLNGGASYPWASSNPERFDSKFKELLKPFRLPTNNKALLIGQVAGDASIKHLNVNELYVRLNNELQSKGWKVYFRPHPKNRGDYPKLNNVVYVSGNLHNNFDTVSLVVTINSNTGVEAVLYGLPTVTVDDGAMSWDVTMHAVPKAPLEETKEFFSFDRLDWAAKLAWKQFNKEEMESGLCFEMIKNHLK